MYGLRQLGPLLQVISRTQAVLVGGQAVNFWSERYAQDASPWKELRPFTSVDVDLLGNQADAKVCAEGTGGDLELPDAPAHTPNAAKVHCRQPKIDIDVLHTANGLNTAEALQTAVHLRHAGLPLRVLHPALCVESKTANLLTLDQTVAGRQDEKHLRLALANCREFLRELTQQGRPPDGLLRWAERLRAHANTQAGLDIQRRFQLDFQEAVPIALWRQTEGALRQWSRDETPHWRDEVRQKLQDLEEIQRWVRDLKQRPPRPRPT